jgi:hypothetical protein
MSLDGVTDASDVFVQTSRFTFVTNDDELGPYKHVRT